MLICAPRDPLRARLRPSRRRVPARPRRAASPILSGCAQPVLEPDFNEAAIRLLNRTASRCAAKGEGAAAPSSTTWAATRATPFAKRNIDAWIAEMDGEGLDAIVITASGCGTTIKDYGFMFRDDPAYADKGARVSEIAMDITEYALGLKLMPPVRETDLVVAYHSACSMQARPADPHRAPRPC
jgi:glycolate oxidase iron-sulfur subunit